MINLLEEEEEEWPEAGAQNPEEAEQYVERINNIFDHLSTLIHEDKKDALGQTIKNFKKLVAKQWEMMGDADNRRRPSYHQGPHHNLSTSTAHKGRSQGIRSPRRNPDWPRIHLEAAQKNQMCRRNCLHI